MRPPVLIAAFFALSGFILGLLTLLAGSTMVGSTNGFMTYACILQVCLLSLPLPIAPTSNLRPLLNSN